MGSALRTPRVITHRHWLVRFAILTGICFLPLLLIGGLVTTTGSGMSVRGWPDSFGANMFLYPISLMTSHQAVFLEHSHRLFGTFVGLTVVVLTAWVFLAKVGGGIGPRVAGLLILVCIQGALGGFRVTENSLFLSMLHGVTGQLTFAAAILVMMLLLPSYDSAANASPDPDARKRKALATALLHSTILQLIMGAAYRHLRHADSPGATHALWGHIFFSLIVVGAGVMAATLARSRPGNQPHDRLMRGIGIATVTCVALQFLLGWLAFYFVHTGNSKGSIPLPEQLATAQSLRPAEVIFRTIHQGNGAILLALATMGLVLSKRIWRASQPAVVAPAPMSPVTAS
jgi:cytochrome c oxidase assembly protein subunit 15